MEQNSESGPAIVITNYAFIVHFVDADDHIVPEALCAKTAEDFIIAAKTKKTQDGLRCKLPQGADLSGLDLDGINLSGAIMRGANLQNASTKNANFSGADLTGATVNTAFFQHISSENWPPLENMKNVRLQLENGQSAMEEEPSRRTIENLYERRANFAHAPTDEKTRGFNAVSYPRYYNPPHMINYTFIVHLVDPNGHIVPDRILTARTAADFIAYTKNPDNPVHQAGWRYKLPDGADLSNCDFDGALLAGADFRGANVQGSHFGSADLTDAILDQDFFKKLSPSDWPMIEKMQGVRLRLEGGELLDKVTTQRVIAPLYQQNNLPLPPTTPKAGGRTARFQHDLERMQREAPECPGGSDAQLMPALSHS